MRAAILRAIVDGSKAWSSAEAIAEKIGGSHDDVLIELEAMQAAGFADRWFDDRWTLSPLSAEELHASIIDDPASSEIDALKWQIGEPPAHRPSYTAIRLTEEHASAIADIPDPGPGPALLAEVDETIERAFASCGKPRLRPPLRVHGKPLPIVILTGCASTWSERTTEELVVVNGIRKYRAYRRRWEVCPACRGSDLSGSSYCLRCDRWGYDAMLAAMRAKAAERRRAG